MNEQIVHEILRELFSSLEALETQSAAILQLVKDKGLATDQEVASHLEQAGNAANVRWRAAQVRIEHLISGALKTEEQGLEREAPRPQEKKDEAPANSGGETAQVDKDKKDVAKTPQDAPGQIAEAGSSDASAEKNRGQAAKQNSEEPQQTDRQNAA